MIIQEIDILIRALGDHNCVSHDLIIGVDRLSHDLSHLESFYEKQMLASRSFTVA